MLREYVGPIGIGLVLLACSSSIEDSSLNGAISFEANRPTAGEKSEPAPYTGNNGTVLAAQERLNTGLDLQQKVIHRTCGPTGGVCHNSKEYPDLHTPGNFLDAVGAPCNVQSGTPEAVFDGCEPPGDRLVVGDGGEVEVGYLAYYPGEFDPEKDEIKSDSPGLHISLSASVGEFKRRYVNVQFIRAFELNSSVRSLPFANFQTDWWTLDGGKKLYGRVRDYQNDTVQQLLAVGIEEGDTNRNGVFGAVTAPITMIVPGSPETSYLVGRLRGKIADAPIPGTLMPLANQPLDVSEMLALYCFIAGLKPGVRADLASRIDYASCPYSAAPESLNLLGAGVTWASRIQSVLEFNCGGCHSGANPQGGLDLADGDVYSRLLKPSLERPDLKLVEPSDITKSYLWLKMVADPSIVGLPMPLDAMGKPRMMSQAELDDIKTWIETGAVENRK
ncbi:MAG: hypothetical protein SFV15_25165 [Polyangiaceae bacterium]|nr:hypothetical protein [Polyangiaceae bacterium]